MNAQDIQIGQRVRVSDNGRTALVVGKPQTWTANSKLVNIKYEQSTRFEFVRSVAIEALPIAEQYPALGGSYQRPVGEIV